MSAIPAWATGLDWVECADEYDTDSIFARYNYPPLCVVQTRDGEFYTVGQINTQGGRCNCCGALTYDPVVRYAFVLPLEEKP